MKIVQLLNKLMCRTSKLTSWIRFSPNHHAFFKKGIRNISAPIWIGVLQYAFYTSPMSKLVHMEKDCIVKSTYSVITVPTHSHLE